MEAAEEFVESLLVARAADEGRREIRRRRRVDFINSGNSERKIHSRAALSHILQRSSGAKSHIECELSQYLGEVGRWWDCISQHVLEEKRECMEAKELQRQLHSMYLSTAMKREVAEHSSVITNDEKRLQELEENYAAEQKQAREEAAKEAMENIMRGVERSIEFLEAHAIVKNSRNNLISDIAIKSFIRKINETVLTERDRAEITFALIFGTHPFHLTGDPFLLLLHFMYEKANPGISDITRFDICHKPLFLIDGPKLGGKTVVSNKVSTELSLLHLSDRDLVHKAMEAYRKERDGPPTLFTVEDSSALPILLAHEERNTQGEEVDYYIKSHIKQITESYIRLSPWALIGKTIENALLNGEPVDSSIVVKLIQLQMENPPEECTGILFEGAVKGVEELKCLQQVIPEIIHPFEGVLQDWPPLPPMMTTKTIMMIPNGEQRETSHGEQQQQHQHHQKQDQQQHQDSQEKKKEEYFSDLFLVLREVRHERSSAKGEGKTRPLKKGVDLSTLPPPVLPEVIKPELSPEELHAIEIWEQQKRNYPLFGAVIHIKCGAKEIFSRFAGLRVDKETREQYHMIFHPPPAERVPFIVNLDRTRTSTAQLHRVILNQQKNWEDMRRFLLREKGIDENVYEVNGERPLEEISSEVKHILYSAQREFEIIHRMYNAAMAAKAKLKDIKANILEQEERRETERKRLISIYSECGAPIPSELEVRPILPPYYIMPNDLPQFFLQALINFRMYYENEYSWSGKSLEKLVNSLLEHRGIAMSAFNYFCNQPDDKQEKLDLFISNYNRIPISLLGQVACKEELHLLVDHLKENLFRTLELTGKESLAKIEQLTRKESFLGPWSISICNVGIATVQAELERFLSTMNLVVMYFSSVVDEPCIFEDLELEVIIMRATAESLQDQGKGKEKKTQASKKVPRLDEAIEKTVEDLFSENIGKLITSITNFVEKISGHITASIKARESSKGANALSEDGKSSLVLTKCLPFAESELSKVQDRIICIKQLFTQILNEGEIYCTNMKDEMLSSIREKQINQASAINTAIYIIRNSIEEERSLPNMHLGRETFYCDYFSASISASGMAPALAPLHSSLTSSLHSSLPPLHHHHQQQQQQQQIEPEHISLLQALQLIPGEPHIHATLLASRLFDIINTFRIVAPDYALSHAEFFHIIRPDDYAGAEIKSQRLKTQQEVFSSFDPLGCGLIDWREFIMHLLLWCAPPPEVHTPAEENYYIHECSVEELLQTREDVGLEFITEEIFFDIPFFFDKSLRDERLAVYVRALWLTFAAPDGRLDPRPLLSFLCADRQPLRGAQKIFYILSLEERGALTPGEMEAAFHMHVTNPRAMCRPDVFSLENITTLYDGAPSLSFQSVCERVMGRSMLNSTEAFHRKSFTTDASYVE